MDPLHLLQKYFGADTDGFASVFTHSRLVADKAVAIAREIPGADVVFVEEAALLHDIGVCRVHAPNIGCTGNLPYILHGLTGKEILDHEGFPKHALVCERHIGVGLTAADIIRQMLPLPHRDMAPLSIEEKIICYADLFFSKKPRSLVTEKSPEEVRRNLLVFGEEKVAIFDRWHQGLW